MIEDSLFRLNVPGKSTLRDPEPARDSEDDDNHRGEFDSQSNSHYSSTSEDNHHFDCLDMEGLKSVSADNVCVYIIIYLFALTYTIQTDQARILDERSRGHQTGIKAVLADHRMKKDIERLQHETNENLRKKVIQRMVEGSKNSELPCLAWDSKGVSDHSRDDEDNEEEQDEDEKQFLEAYRLKRLLEIEREAKEKIFGAVEIVSHELTFYSICYVLTCSFVPEG